MTFPDYPPAPDFLETEPRYTTVQAVKDAMGIDDTSMDLVVKEAIVTIEILIDAYLGTSYPQTPELIPNDNPKDPPPIEGIPIQLSKAAKLGAIALVKLDDAPFGAAGSDEFFQGMIEPDTAGRAFNSVLPLLKGLRRSWPVA